MTHERTPTAPAAAPQDAPLVTPAPWESLRRFTDARIALGRAGHSLPTRAHLAFGLAHAQARDAVQVSLDALGVAQGVADCGLSSVELHSAAADRETYLQRPDLGRRLDAPSRKRLQDWAAGAPAGLRHNLALVVADGLSARAVHENATPLLKALLSLLRDDAAQGWTMAPVAVVHQGRVAVGDEVGELLQANTVVVLIGERPGLSSPDSLGIYLSWAPRPGLLDAQRNCISNVRPAGLSIDGAASKLHGLLARARQLQLTGIGLKDTTDLPAPDQAQRLLHASDLAAPSPWTP